MKTIAVVTLVFLPGTFVAVRYEILSVLSRHTYGRYHYFNRCLGNFQYVLIQLAGRQGKRGEASIRLYLDIFRCYSSPNIDSHAGLGLVVQIHP